MQIVSFGEICMKCQILFLRKSKYYMITLLSAESVQRMVNVKSRAVNGEISNIPTETLVKKLAQSSTVETVRLFNADLRSGTAQSHNSLVYKYIAKIENSTISTLTIGTL